MAKSWRGLQLTTDGCADAAIEPRSHETDRVVFRITVGKRAGNPPRTHRLCRDAIAAYASRSSRSAFDREHGVGILLDDSTGKAYFLSAGGGAVQTLGSPPVIWSTVVSAPGEKREVPSGWQAVDFFLESQDRSRSIVRRKFDSKSMR
jgi:hypothetical protein